MKFTGLGTVAFQEQADAAFLVMKTFQDMIPEDQATFSKPQNDGDKHVFLEASNRYVWRVSEAINFNTLPITDDMDPWRHLRSAIGTNWVYTDDNEVQCFRRIKLEKEEGKEHFT